ncbi:hypothetical protein H0H87_006318 [Tephrocybe sp. NHM501043]|nr:hypothetical protein H0H87_006318 [Tephrocybe sp. NHM501043]
MQYSPHIHYEATYIDKEEIAQGNLEPLSAKDILFSKYWPPQDKLDLSDLAETSFDDGQPWIDPTLITTTDVLATDYWSQEAENEVSAAAEAISLGIDITLSWGVTNEFLYSIPVGPFLNIIL